VIPWRVDSCRRLQLSNIDPVRVADEFTSPSKKNTRANNRNNLSWASALCSRRISRRPGRELSGGPAAVSKADHGLFAITIDLSHPNRCEISTKFFAEIHEV
jgi:hypothetical protein